MTLHLPRIAVAVGLSSMRDSPMPRSQVGTSKTIERTLQSGFVSDCYTLRAELRARFGHATNGTEHVVHDKASDLSMLCTTAIRSFNTTQQECSQVVRYLVRLCLSVVSTGAPVRKSYVPADSAFLIAKRATVAGRRASKSAPVRMLSNPLPGEVLVRIDMLEDKQESSPTKGVPE